METENSQKLFSVSITHNSKIRELSDGNIVIVCQTNFLLWVLPFLSYELWKQRIDLSKLAIQTGSKLPSIKHKKNPFLHTKVITMYLLEDKHVRSKNQVNE